MSVNYKHIVKKKIKQQRQQETEWEPERWRKGQRCTQKRNSGVLGNNLIGMRYINSQNQLKNSQVLWSCSGKASVLSKKIFSKKIRFKSWLKLLNRAWVSDVRWIYMYTLYFFISFYIFISQLWSNGQITGNVTLIYTTQDTSTQ